MNRASKPIRHGFCLIVSFALAPIYSAAGHGLIELAPDANAVSLADDTLAVRNAGAVIGAILGEAGYQVFDRAAATSSGIGIRYAVYADIRKGTYLTRASLRVEARLFETRSGRLLGRVERFSNNPIRISESCVGRCVDMRLGAASAEIARRVAAALQIRLRGLSRLARGRTAVSRIETENAATRPSRDW
jgi:hypothetical protein